MAWEARRPETGKLYQYPKGNGPLFQLKRWPAHLYEQLAALPVQQPAPNLDGVRDHDEYLAAMGITFDQALDLVRHGVTGWSGMVDDRGAPIDPATVPGREGKAFFVTLAPEALHVLDFNDLVPALALEVWQFNTGVVKRFAPPERRR